MNINHNSHPNAVQHVLNKFDLKQYTKLEPHTVHDVLILNHLYSSHHLSWSFHAAKLVAGTWRIATWDTRR